MKRLFLLLPDLLQLSASAKSIYSLKVKNAQGREIRPEGRQQVENGIKYRY